MKGHLHLVCAPDANGRSSLASQSVAAPMHVSKPWWEDNLLIVNAINSTAGLFSGDEIDVKVEVIPGAELLLTSPSASRAHRMPTGRAIVRQSYKVSGNAWLEIHPALFIPQAGSTYEQETAITLDPGARFLFCETIAPGRIAHGECWQFTSYQSRFRLTYDNHPIAHESYAITPDSPTVRALRSQFPTACHATFYAAGIEFPDDVLTALTALHHRQCWVGCTRLDAPAIAIRIVASDNIELSRTLAKSRNLLHRAFGRALPPLRRS